MWKSPTTVLFMAAASPVNAEVQLPPPDSCAHIATAKYNDCSRMNVFRCEAEGGLVHRYDVLDDSDLLTFFWDEQTDEVVVSLDWTSDGGLVGMNGNRVLDAIASGASAFAVAGEVTIMGMKKPFSANFDYQSGGEVEVVSGIEFQLVNANQLVNAKVKITPPPPIEEIEASLVVAHDPATGLSIIKQASLKGDDSDGSFDLEQVLFPGQPGFEAAPDPAACEFLGDVEGRRTGIAS